ncbi:16S rRNA (guanine(966)-N(2))-methyltransferase RsmD [bacterium]|nr:16S rRNA (guanine(966)-N(2))-methyltransferase RsmD [bacterium]
MLRVTGGVARGRKLKSPKGLVFRPTTSRVKEFIFSVIGPNIEGAGVLDLFSGSGALGIEALSRGAKWVTFVEQSASNIHMIEQNLELCGFRDCSSIIRGDVFKVLGSFGGRQVDFKYVLADPPFKMSFRSRIVMSVYAHDLVGNNGQLIIEHQDNDPDNENASVRCVRQKKFGHCVVSIYQKRG